MLEKARKIPKAKPAGKRNRRQPRTPQRDIHIKCVKKVQITSGNKNNNNGSQRMVIVFRGPTPLIQEKGEAEEEERGSFCARNEFCKKKDSIQINGNLFANSFCF